MESLPRAVAADTAKVKCFFIFGPWANRQDADISGKEVFI